MRGRPRWNVRTASLAALILAGVLSGAGAPAAAPGNRPMGRPANARIDPVVDDYFGTPVADPYRWMETPGSAELLAWMHAQSDFTRRTLDALPGRAKLAARIHDLDQATADVFGIVAAGDHYFYFRTNPGETVPKVYVRDGLKGAERLLVDPNPAPVGGSHNEIGWIEPSKDGRYLAYGIAAGGGEWGTLHVIDVPGGRELPENNTRIWAGDGSSVSWLPDNKTFSYLRFPELKTGQPPQEKQLRSQVHLHTLDRNVTGDGDAVIFGYGADASIPVPPEAFSTVTVLPGAAYALATFGTVDVDQAGVYVAPVADLSRARARWRRVAGPEDQISSIAQFAVRGDRLFVLTRHEAPHFKVVSVDLRRPDMRKARVVVPESAAVIEDLAPAADGLYVQDLRGGLGALRRMNWSSFAVSDVALPFAGTIRKVYTTASAPGALLRLRSWTESNRIFATDGSHDLADTGWQEPAKADFSAIESREVMAVSYDGTRVPLSILIRKGAVLDGSHPALLESYGAYGVFGIIKPYFDPLVLAWLERGGVIATAHPRGGGDFGEEWHRGGMKETKLNTVYDTLACAQYLVDEHYTTPKTLAVSGASAGGITMGGAITRRPELFAAAIDHAGATDMLRMETTANGPDNVPEFGSTKTVAGFHALYAMSPYAQVHDGTAYPAVLLETGVNDPRVDSWIIAKMAARLEQASISGNPVLLRVDFDTGHFGGTKAQTEGLLADEYSFLLWRFGAPDFQPKSRPAKSP